MVHFCCHLHCKTTERRKIATNYSADGFINFKTKKTGSACFPFGLYFKAANAAS